MMISYADEMSTPLSPPLGFLLSHLGEVLRERTAKELTAFGLSPREYGVLWRLAAHGPLSQRELGELHRIDRTTVVAVIDALEERALVVRELDPDDRRRRRLVLTRAGRSLLAEAGDVVDRSEEELQSALSATERRQLLRLLVKVNDAQATP
jgi:DNA-binding MarR family transcriptional regulator